MNRRTFCQLPALAILSCPPSTPRLWFAGDSITVGLGATHANLRWADRLSGGRVWQNIAIGASRIPEQAQAIAEAPIQAGDWLYWLPGYNDMRSTEDLSVPLAILAQSIASIRARGIVLRLGNGLAPGPVAGAYGTAERAAWLANQIDHLAPTQDTHSAYDPAIHCSWDGLHPNEDGHGVIAEAMRGSSVWLPFVS